MTSPGLRRPLVRLAAAVLALAIVLAGAAGVVLWRVEASLDASIDRFDLPRTATEAPGDGAPGVLAAGLGAAAAVGAPSGRDGATNLLVLGSDSRISAGDPSQWAVGAQRTDAIMVVHVPADRSSMYVVSIPRDSWVDIPGHGKAKINAAFSWGGPALTVSTVERLTGLPIDHMVITDFTGFARITDLLGGVDVTIPETTHGNTHGQGENFTAGTHHLDGASALTYVRQRYVLPAGDFDRVKRQQNWIRAIGRRAADSGVRTDPQRLYALLEAMASSLTTDTEFTIGEMRELAWSLRHVEPGAVRFLTVPLAGTGTSADGQSIVLLNGAGGRGLWRAMRADRTQDWLDATGYQTLGDRVR